MSHHDFDLHSATAWMQAVVRNPGGVRQGVLSPEARTFLDLQPDQIGSVLTASKALSAAERLSIYNRAYHFRLLECLRAQFPCLLHLLEPEVFNSFASGYLSNWPSTSYTLNDLGSHFTDYLSATRPDKDVATEARESWIDFIIELAVLERAFYEIYDGLGTEKEVPFTLDHLAALEHSENLKLTPVVCLRLFAFQYPVNRYFSDVRLQRDPPIPMPTETFVVVSRKDYIVRTYEISAKQFALLDALVHGETVGNAARLCQIELAQASAWIREWVFYGFVQKVWI